MLIFPLSRRHSSCLFCQFRDDLPSINPRYTTSLRISWDQLRVEELLVENEQLPRKQRYTSHKIFELLQAEG